MEPKIFDRQALVSAFRNQEVKPLNDIFMIEDVANYIKDIEQKIDFYKEYKKKKNDKIKKSIEELDNMKNFFKEVIMLTLDEEGKKSIPFPDSYKVSKRSTPDNWSIEDKEALLDYLKKEKVYDDFVTEVVDYKIDMKEIKKFFKESEKVGKEIPGIVKQDASESLSISQNKGFIKPINMDIESLAEYDIEDSDKLSSKEENINDNKYDGLDFPEE